MAHGERDRWRADRLEPFNAGMDGVSLDAARDAVGDPSSYGRARIAMWLIAIVCIALGALGRSVFLLVVGLLLALWLAWLAIRRARQ